MTTEEAIKRYEKEISQLKNEPSIIRNRMEPEWQAQINARSLALAALRAQQERENPKPLTPDELREMDGEPVFITHSKYGKGWCIIDWHGVNKSWFYFSKTGTSEGMTAVPITAVTYGEYWLAYRHKPKEEPK